ncbi:tyrosine-protein phosphatase [Nonomuraea sediminis]|uniref:tyrosine-protein phosphatase n=1 Tax=Nonomuraea sediminis TaxID=2835864 RepID=UPI001BDC1073|nr:tyrosine-protein phosphatase [Nonomuraea sediminis]
MILDWPGCQNARDLGSGRIRRGALVRSGRPGRDTVEAIFAHGVTRVLDLRLAAETDDDPSPLAGHPAYRNLSVLRAEDTLLQAMGDTLPAIYRAVLDRGQVNLAAVLGAVARAPEGGVLVHCHQGKDRTGLVVALALALAGVPEQEIAADYALTARHVPPGQTWMLDQITAATMLATLAYLRERYGGAEPYLLDGGLGPEEVALVRARLTAP